jgi:hypothetical protein
MGATTYLIPINTERALRRIASIAALWLVYLVTVEALAWVLLHDPVHKVVPEFTESMHHFVGPPNTLPALCRWDCAWYVTIANGPYPGVGDSAHNVCFFPFYGLLMRAVASLFHLSPPWAAAWISRWALLGSMILLFDVGRAFGLKERERWAAIMALLLSPDAFVLLSGYADGLFLFLSLATFGLALRGRPLLACIPAACAGITRIHGFPLVAGLVVFGALRAWKAPDKRRGLLELAPAAACSCALLGLMAYFFWTTKDPIVFVHEQHFFGKSAGGPLMAWDALVGTWRSGMPPDSIGTLYWGLQSVVAAVWCGTIVVLAYTRSWVALAYVAAAYAMALSSGTHWGGWRYLAEVFPAWFAIARLRRWPSVWAGWLFAGAALQFCFLVNFVALRAPGP